MDANAKTSSNASEHEGTVASLLRGYRLAAGLSQAELAERANISVAAIASLEQGLRKSPHTFTLNNIADALGLTPAERTQFNRSAKRSRDHRTAAGPQSTSSANLPVLLSSFVQRAETVDLERLLSMHRLVTVTGTAGVGKTRTVLEVAAEYKSSDVAFIDLSPVTDNGLVAAQIATAMGVPTVNRGAILSDLSSRIGDRTLLIVLDCCERVLEGAAGSVLVLLRSCPNLRFAATSREPLGLSNEIVYRLPSLNAPEALELFVTRAQAADARITIGEDDVKAVTEICRRLDGIPLAIELAAARTPLLGISGLREHLSVLSLDNTVKDVPERHHTMTAAIEWSFSLLSDHERRLIRRLSIFAASFALESAEAVCADGDLPSDLTARLIFDLVRKSLVETKVAEPSNRYYLLDAVRAYAALELAAAGEKDLIAGRLAEWFLHFVRTCGDHTHGLASVHAMLPDLDNIRAVIETKLRDGSRENVAVAGELVGSYRWLWMSTHRELELCQLCKAVTHVLDEAAYPNVSALVATAMVWTVTAYSLHGIDILKAAVEANLKVGDFAQVSAHLANLASHLLILDRPKEALECTLRAEEVLQQVSPSSRIQQYVRSKAALVFTRTGDISQARRTIAELDETKTRQGASDDADYLLRRNYAVAEINFVAGDYASASTLCRETIYRAVSVSSLDPVWFSIRFMLIASELMLDRIDSAAEECHRLLVDRLGHVFFEDRDLDAPEFELMENIALVAAKRGMSESAARLLASSEHGWTWLGYTSRLTGSGLIAKEAHRLLEHALPKGELHRALDAGERMTTDDARQLVASVLAHEVSTTN